MWALIETFFNDHLTNRPGFLIKDIFPRTKKPTNVNLLWEFFPRTKTPKIINYKRNFINDQKAEKQYYFPDTENRLFLDNVLMKSHKCW